eukprot:TRINITY_DN7740_c0_g1_i1.p1 TRINITY_DN7740_c0_g1~~TRINITY_DN7740_c0_g1_i1.p1  ORF type:complete len:554 (+),score=107.20 TRINITY_DN7740_c0_g1_i1:208-1662(+)
MDVDGWTHFAVSTGSVFSDSDQAFAAGFLEGALSQHRIYQYYINFCSNEFNLTTGPERLMTWLDDNLSWVRLQAQSQTSDAYWRHIALILSQLDGLAAGYASVAPASEALDVLDLAMINAAGDIETLGGVVKLEAPVTSSRFMRSERAAAANNNTVPMLDCSALVRVLPGTSNVFSSQATWRGYFAMLRAYKFYNYAFADKDTAALNHSFSSQPGFLSSKDDFYMTSQGLVTMETTNDVFDKSLYQHITTQSVLCWMRSIVANMLAVNGSQWTQIFARYNSGTYNNQWMVVDYKRVVPGQPIAAHTLWLAEQIPGTVERADVSDVLAAQGYWPSYNIPYFKSIYNVSGYPARAAQNPEYSYENCARALIFKRNATAVTSDTQMRALMLYNNFQTDPLSQGNAARAIASRYDLTNSKSAFGAIDAKNTCYFRSKTLEASAISGPTHEQQAPFSWGQQQQQQWPNVRRDGVPDTFDFDWVEMQNSH